MRATGGGKSSAAVPLAEGWQTVTLTLPGGALVEGENKITLGFANSGHFGDKKASAAVEWIDIGAAVGGDGAAGRSVTHGALAIAKGDALSWYVRCRPAARSSPTPKAPAAACKVRAVAHGSAHVDGALADDAPLELGAARRQGRAADAQRRRRRLRRASRRR